MIVCKDGCFALHTVYTNCQLRAGLPAIRGAHGATAHNARSHGKCACYPIFLGFYIAPFLIGASWYAKLYVFN